MVKLRKGPVCRGTLTDGSSCETRVARPGDRCGVCLERLATSHDVATRLALAADGNLPLEIFEVLANDIEDAVRLAIANRADCPLVILQELEQDHHGEVRAAAATALWSAFTPRVLHETEAGKLFSRAELDALADRAVDGDSDARTAPPALPGPPIDEIPDLVPAPRRLAGARAAGPARSAGMAGPARDALFSGIEEILARLDELGTRLTSLEAVLAATGERLGAINDRLGDLGGAGEHTAPLVAAAAVSAPPSASLLPVVHPAELGTGPVIRTDIVAAAWLAVLPLLARKRGARAQSMTVGQEAVAGPFAPVVDVAVAELPPAGVAAVVAAVPPAGVAAAVAERPSAGVEVAVIERLPAAVDGAVDRLPAAVDGAVVALPPAVVALPAAARPATTADLPDKSPAALPWRDFRTGRRRRGAHVRRGGLRR